MTDQPRRYQVNSRASQRLTAGYPWVFRSDVVAEASTMEITSSGPATFTDHVGRIVAMGFANPKNQLLGRVLARGEAILDKAFFLQKFAAALAWRQTCYPGQDFYRLVHAESDGLPGLVVDRFGDTLVVQVNSAGMESLQQTWLSALQEIVPVKNIVLKNDGNTRILEGLAETIDVIQGDVPQDGHVRLFENGVQFLADVRTGQKTGWFYDQRPHRAWLAGLAHGKSVLDMFCHTGGFGVTAAAEGATRVVCVDSSAAALEIVKLNAALNGVAEKVETLEGKAFDVMPKLSEHKFDIVSVDPPAFIKTRKDMVTGLKGYEKLARLAAPLVEKGGVLFYASCSSHPSEKDILDAVLAGCGKAKRQACLVYSGTAGPDHPMHPHLPETRYLKALGFRLY